MTRIFRSAFASLFAVGVAASLTGCKVDCDKDGDKTTCIGQSTVQYTGTPIAQSFAWSDGQRLKVSVTGGNLRVGNTASTSITINPYSQGGAPAECSDTSKICVRFIPINNDTKDRRDEATRQMKQVGDGGNLQTSVGSDEGGVLVAVTQNAQNGKYNSTLSAVVDVWVPANFNGDIVATSDSGGISVRGARKAAVVQTGLGSIAFDLADILPNTADNKITTENGDIIFTVPKTANINIQGQVGGANDTVLIDNVEGWSQVEGSTDQAATFCGNTACDGHADGLWKLQATKLGSIQIKLN